MELLFELPANGPPLTSWSLLTI